jgi:hypothetical protein
MRVFVELLRERVGSPLSLASLARDLAVSPTTLRRYLDILAALYVVIVVQPWHRNIARALLQAPKVYFNDTGLVKGDAGVRFENAVAVILHHQVHQLVDSRGCEAGLHYIRTKDGTEVDFCLSVDGHPSQLVECKLADTTPHRALSRFAGQFPEAAATQIVRDARQGHGSEARLHHRPEGDQGIPSGWEARVAERTHSPTPCASCCTPLPASWIRVLTWPLQKSTACVKSLLAIASSPRRT